ncbi:hypothetical protein [Nocardia jiangxiensis]|uniref:hypothetical protein n=1 Tax=Nocardia jiangxiensis TaxID=282685 RepID=UPI0002F83554|nr:hypothetical protein [Nocardia jiangxiensis]
MTAPDQGAPLGDYIFAYGPEANYGTQSSNGQTAGVKGVQSDWTTTTIQNMLKGTPIASFTNAQNVHQSNVLQPIADNATHLTSSSLTLANHENRITKLENGQLIAVYYVNDVWHKPTGYSTHKVICIAGSGGGMGGEDSGPEYGGQGGGMGGWQETTFNDSDLSLSSYAVTIGIQGIGAYAYYYDDFGRANSTSLGANWRIDSGSNSPQIISNTAEARTDSGGAGENGQWATYVGGEMLCDDVTIEAVVVAPSIPEATDNVTCVYFPAPTTYSSSSKIVVFGASTGSGSGMMTQVNAPVSPYSAEGTLSGQTVVAQSSTSVAHGQTISLTRRGNVFTGKINGVTVCTWTDTGSTVPTGAGNRHFGFITEGNYPVFQNDFHSPAIDTITAINLDGTAGTASSFTGTDGTSVVAGGGPPGSVYNAGGPASPGTGNTSTYNAGGGTGGSPTSIPGTAGGNGANATGGAGATTDGLSGSDGTNLPTGSYGPAAGGGGGAGSASGEGGQGGSGGYPGGAGGGGGGCIPGETPGGGGGGNAGMVWVISTP